MELQREICKSEIKWVLKRMKNKARGKDGRYAELWWKTKVNILHILRNKILNERGFAYILKNVRTNQVNAQKKRVSHCNEIGTSQTL